MRGKLLTLEQVKEIWSLNWGKLANNITEILERVSGNFWVRRQRFLSRGFDIDFINIKLQVLRLRFITMARNSWLGFQLHLVTSTCLVFYQYKNVYYKLLLKLRETFYESVFLVRFFLELYWKYQCPLTTAENLQKHPEVSRSILNLRICKSKMEISTFNKYHYKDILFITGVDGHYLKVVLSPEI